MSLDLPGLSGTASRIENAVSCNDTDPQIVEYEDDDEDYYEEDVDWYTGHCDDEQDETAYGVGPPTDDPEPLEQFDGNLEDADASASQVYASASRSFQEARELLARVKSARGYFPAVGIGAFDGLAQPSTDRKPAKPRGKGKKGKRKGKSSSQKGEKLTSVGTPGIWPKPQTSRFESRPRCPRSVRLKLAQLMVDHITLLVFVLISACCVDKWDIVLQNVQKEKRPPFHLENVRLVPMLQVAQCSIPLVMVRLSKKANKIKPRVPSKTLLRFQSRVWRGSQFLMEEPWRPFLDS